MKYMGVCETTQMCSEWNEDDYKTACLELFKQRYGHKFGDFFAVYQQYLKERNKFSSFCTKIEEEQRGGKRPIGKKKAHQAEQVDAKLVKAVVSEVFVKQEPGTNSTSLIDMLSLDGSAVNNGSGGRMRSKWMHNIAAVISNVGTALLENMKSEQDMRLAQQSLDTPTAGRHLQRSSLL